MTTQWYQVVLERLDPNSTVLDIGVGTAGATPEKCDDSISNRLTALEGALQAGKDLQQEQDVIIWN
jgi:hypothetical protein